MIGHSDKHVHAPKEVVITGIQEEVGGERMKIGGLLVGPQHRPHLHPATEIASLHAQLLATTDEGVEDASSGCACGPGCECGCCTVEREDLEEWDSGLDGEGELEEDPGSAEPDWEDTEWA